MSIVLQFIRLTLVAKAGKSLVIEILTPVLYYLRQKPTASSENTRNTAPLGSI